MIKCKYCNKEFETSQKLGGHIIHCKLNPNYEQSLKQLEKARKNINKETLLYCKFCGKEVHNKGCLIIHEKSCNKNPNKEKCLNRKGNKGNNKGHIAWNKGLTKETDERIRKSCETFSKNYKEGKFKLGTPHNEESKKLLSKKRKKWLQEHKDQHVWRRDSKFLSIPCENLKLFLKNKGINFVEEYEPFDDVHYCLDIAWPDEKIAIEVNGNQHYNKDGKLSDYYQKRHKLFEDRGWTIFEIHYSKCFNININDFNDILNLSIYDKDYVNKYFSKKELKEQKKKEQKLIKDKQKQEIEQNHKKIIYNLITNSGIDFSKSGWSTQAVNYLENQGELWNKHIFQLIRKYYPEFLQREDVWKRKGSKY